MKSMTLVVACLALNAVAAEIRVVSIQEATTKKGSPFAGASGEPADWTLIMFEGAPLLEAMRTDGWKSMLFVGDWPCSFVRRGTRGWCVVPRLKNPGIERLWGPVRVAVGRDLDKAKIAQLRTGAEANGAKLADATAGPSLMSETLGQLLTELVKD